MIFGFLIFASAKSVINKRPKAHSAYALARKNLWKKIAQKFLEVKISPLNFVSELLIRVRFPSLIGKRSQCKFIISKQII